MAQVRPSQVVALIDQTFPFAATQRPNMTDHTYLDRSHSAQVAAISHLAEQLPSELVTLEAHEYTAFSSSIAVIKNALAIWQSGDRDFKLVGLRGFGNLHPLAVLRRALTKCPEEIPAVRKLQPGRQPLPPPSLVVPRAEAAQRVKHQIDQGRSLQNQPIPHEEAFANAKLEMGRWLNYTKELLKRLFDNAAIADEYDSPGMVVSEPDAFALRVDRLTRKLTYELEVLERIYDRLELIPEVSQIAAQSAKSASQDVSTGLSASSDVFVVHGHDNEAKESVSRFLEKLGLRPIVLHEQPNLGRTIIEKFEACSNVAFAVVLLTPDDVGAPKRERESLRPRARQNVILELGYFLGKLGRTHVCALHKEFVEIPTDYCGVLFLQMDTAGAWRLSLARELKNAGLDVDLNRL